MKKTFMLSCGEWNASSGLLKLWTLASTDVPTRAASKAHSFEILNPAFLTEIFQGSTSLSNPCSRKLVPFFFLFLQRLVVVAVSICFEVAGRASAEKVDRER
jgi:hypothetical protein